MGKRNQKHAHNCCVFFLGIAAIVLIAVAVGYYDKAKWYTDEVDTQVWPGGRNVTIQYSFANITTITTYYINNGKDTTTDTGTTAWGDAKSPNLWKVYQTSQSLSIIALIASAVLSGATIMHWICKSCSKSCRKMFKWLAFFAAAVAFGSALVAWAAFFRHNVAVQNDYKANNNNNNCNLNICLKFSGKSVTGTLTTTTETWGPQTGFFLVVGASAGLLIALILISVRIFG